MADTIDSATSPTPPLSVSTTATVSAEHAQARLRATQAAAQLRTVLHRVQTARHHRTHQDDASCASPPCASPSTVNCAASDVALVWPLAPLAQRMKEKKAREALRLRRRVSRRQAAAATQAEAASAAAAASGNTTADLVRNAFAQPLGAMAARILTAAASGTPLLFPDAAGPSQLHSSAGPTGGQPSLAVASRSTSPTSGAAAAPCASRWAAHNDSSQGGVHTASLPESTAKPAAAAATATATAGAQRLPRKHVSQASAHGRQHGAPQHSRGHGSPQPRSRLARLQQPALSISQPVRDGFADGSPSLLSLLLHPTHHSASPSAAGARASLSASATSAGVARRRRGWKKETRWRGSQCSRCGQRHRPRSSVLVPADASKTNTMISTSSSRLPPASTDTPVTTDAGDVNDSPISKLARTLRNAGTAALAASPLLRPDSRQPSRHGSYPVHTTQRASSAEDSQSSAAAVWDRSTPNASLSFAKPPPRSRSSSPTSTYCRCSSFSASSRSSLMASGELRVAGAVAEEGRVTPFTPLTLPRPGETHYDVCAGTVSLLHCYADSATRDVFSRVPSTSTQRSVGRSSTPLSSEWSAHSSSLGVGIKEGVTTRRSRSAGQARRGSLPPRRDSADGIHQSCQQGPAHSPTSNTQLSYIAEMDAIEKGVVAPYVSYLFSPEARVVDLRALEGQVRHREPAPPLEATCVGFSQAADAYLVGTSSGLLWRVPVGNSSDVVRATPLGSLWPSQSPTAPPTGGSNVLTSPMAGGAAAAAGSRSASKVATPSSARTTTTTTAATTTTTNTSATTTATAQPMPLPGHTAAVLSIAFNDDGALFVTAGLDGCVIVWNGRACAKVRRISAVWASAAAAATAQWLYPGVVSELGLQAPYLVRFMPQNNNYLLVSHLSSSELHLYNSSTGLPVTNVAGAGAGGGGGLRGIAETLGRLGVGFDADGDGRGGGNSRSRSSGGGSLKDSALRGGDADLGSGTRSAGPTLLTPAAITALAVDRIASPFFLTGDAHGTVVLWTYRAGDVVRWPTLSSLEGTTAAAGASGGAPSASGGGGAHRHSRTRSYVPDTLLLGSHTRTSSSSGGGGGGDGMAAFTVPLYELPELRRVTALALPESMGGVAALAVSTLRTAQLHSLFQRRGPRHEGAAAGAGAAPAQPTPRHPLEATAHLFRSTAEQNRACWASAATATAGAADDVGLRSRREKHSTSAIGGGSDRAAARAACSGAAPASGSSFTQALAALPSRLTDTFSSLWGGSGGGESAIASATVKVPSAQSSTGAPVRSPSPPHTPPPPSHVASESGGAAALSSLSEDVLLRQLRDDALDAVCPLLILVTLPCDTIYVLGMLLQLRPGAQLSGSSGSGPAATATAASTLQRQPSHPPTQQPLQQQQQPAVTYRLYPLLKTTSLSRLRHLGVGAVQSPDNPRVIVVATPCEEGFVRIEPLMRPPPATPPGGAVRTPHHAAGEPAATTTEESGEGCGGAAGPARRSRSHVLATLPMPYGGRCTGVAWSPNGRFLVAITAEGVVYQWARVYLLNTSSTSPRPAASPTAAVDTTAGVPATTATTGNVSATAATTSAAMHAAATTTAAAPRSVIPADGAACTPAIAVDSVVRRRRWATEHSDTAAHEVAQAENFTSLLGAPMASAAAPSSGVGPVVADSSAARAAFSEEDAWRESLRRELERQRRAQAALKLVSRAGADEAAETVSSSGYWLDDGAGSAFSGQSPDDSAMDSELCA